MNKTYWETRYKSGPFVGSGSKQWIKEMERFSDLKNVIDIGCGLMNFWNGREFDFFMGYDISETVIKLNKLQYPKYIFKSEFPIGCIAESVTCISTIFHIPLDDKYERKLFIENTCKCVKNYLFISNYKQDPFIFEGKNNGYIYYRNLDDDMSLFEKNRLFCREVIKLDGEKEKLYIFRKIL